MNTEKQNIEELQKAMHGAIDALFALRDAADKLKKKGAQAPSFAEGGINATDRVFNRTNQRIISHAYRKHPHRDVYYKIIPGTDIVCEAVDADQGVIWHYSPDYLYKGVGDFERVLPEVYFDKVNYVEWIVDQRKEEKCDGRGICVKVKRPVKDTCSNEPDPHDFCANAATAKTCKGTAEQLAARAKKEVHALKNLALLDGDETADKKAGRIYDLIDQIVVCGVSEKRYGNSCILDHNAQHIDIAELTEIAKLRKENAELKERSDELSSRVHSMQNTIMELQQTVEYLNPTFSNIRAGESPNVHFQRVATPLIKYLAENHHPHMQATVTSTSANLWEGHISLPNIHDFLDHND